MRTIRNPPKWGFPLGAAALFGLGPCRSDESTSYVRENSESNGLIGVSFGSTPIVRTRVRQLRQQVQRKSRGVCSRATWDGQNREGPTSQPTRSTPAIF